MGVSGCQQVGNLVICRGPEMREIRREPWETRWCFSCRRRLMQEAVVFAPTEPSYYGPHVEVQCVGCGGDYVRFPGTADGPTLELVASPLPPGEQLT